MMHFKDISLKRGMCSLYAKRMKKGDMPECMYPNVTYVGLNKKPLRNLIHFMLSIFLACISGMMEWWAVLEVDPLGNPYRNQQHPCSFVVPIIKGLRSDTRRGNKSNGNVKWYLYCQIASVTYMEKTLQNKWMNKKWINKWMKTYEFSMTWRNSRLQYRMVM